MHICTTNHPRSPFWLWGLAESGIKKVENCEWTFIIFTQSDIRWMAAVKNQETLTYPCKWVLPNPGWLYALDRLLSLSKSKIFHFLSQWFLLCFLASWLWPINYFSWLCCKIQLNLIMRLQWLSQVVLYTSFPESLYVCFKFAGGLVSKGSTWSTTQQTRVWSLGPLEKKTATHSSILA